MATPPASAPPPTPDGAPDGDRVVVVGGGGAGAATARALRRAGWPGTVEVLTAEPHAPYDRTMLSKASLLDPAVPPTPLLGEDPAAATPVAVRTDAAVTALHPDQREVALGNGERVAYDHLVLATGAAPRRLDLPGADGPAVHSLRELDGWGALRDAVVGARRIVVIGGGLIGLEVAAAVRHHGGAVVVIEVADRLMGRTLPTAVAAVVAEAHAAHGVQIELGCQPTAIAADGAVSLADGRVLPADAVLVSVGSVPRTDLAAAAGLEVEDGVVVDPALRTADPRILAVGDVARLRTGEGTLAPRTEAWTPALAMGQHAAATIMGGTAAYAEVPWMWSDQYDLRVQAAGAPVGGLDQVVRGAPDDPTGLIVFGLRDGAVHGVVGVSRGNGVGRTVRAGQMLIASGVAVDPEALADPGTDLRRLAQAGR